MTVSSKSKAIPFSKISDYDNQRRKIIEERKQLFINEIKREMADIDRIIDQ